MSCLAVKDIQKENVEKNIRKVTRSKLWKAFILVPVIDFLFIVNP